MFPDYLAIMKTRLGFGGQQAAPMGVPEGRVPFQPQVIQPEVASPAIKQFPLPQPERWVPNPRPAPITDNNATPPEGRVPMPKYGNYGMKNPWQRY